MSSSSDIGDVDRTVVFPATGTDKNVRATSLRAGGDARATDAIRYTSFVHLGTDCERK